jgi:hypothetical protein
MGKQLSGGFDIAGVFSEETIDTIFGLVYAAGLLPLTASTTFDHASETRELNLYFLRPQLEFESLPNVNNPVKIRFPFLAQVPSLNAQRAGAVVVHVTASKLQDLDESDEPFNYVVLDFTTIPVAQYQYKTEPEPDLPFYAQTAFGLLAANIVEDVAAPLARKVLADGIERIPITPQVPSTFGFFTFRTYVDTSFVLPPEVTSYDLPRVLGAFVNFDNHSKNPPSKAPLTLIQHVIPTPHFASYTYAEADDLKIALPETLINAKLDEALKAKGLKPLPATISDHEVTALKVSLANGYILVKGTADDVDFTIHMTLSVENDRVQTNIIYKDFDVPWYLTFFAIFVPIAGQLVRDAVILAIAEGLGSIGDEAGDLLSDISLFSSDLPGLGFAPLKIHNNGDVEISTKGLVLDGQLEPLITSPRTVGFYVHGHLESLEFHRTDKGCPFVEKMKGENTILFLSPAKALEMGYNGCRYCYQEYDEAADGSISVFFRDPNTAAFTRQVSMHFKLFEGLTVDGASVHPQFELKRQYKGEVRADGMLYFEDDGLPPLWPGDWELTVKMGSWSTTCQVPVKKWGSKYGKPTVVAFTAGVQGCGVSSAGGEPNYP